MTRFTIAVAVLVTACGHGTSPPEDHAGHAPQAAPVSAAHAGHGASADGGTPEGYAPVTLDPAQAAALGLATAAVEERDFTKQLRTTGVIALDETRTAHVHPKVRGWIDGIQVNFVGKSVMPGQPLCSIYSQEVFAAETEFLSILDRARGGSIPTGEFADAEKSAQSQLALAARRRLALWDVPKEEIARLEATREVRRTFPLLAPRGGIVVAKQAIEGMYVDPSVELYTLSDLAKVWALADVYEADAPYVTMGAHARLEVEGRGDPIDAVVSFVPPTVDESTRTLKVRFVLDNKDRKLRPGAFASLTMDLAIGRGLAVPESAVIRTGPRTIVFVAHGDPPEHLMPREIQIGPLVGDAYRVTSGLEAGERVATGAQFLIDSESRLRASSSQGGHAGHAGHVH
jgi:Cu(I)/Ag(I) efflux system membrane fusion protein